jgi:hypothetical protein
MERELRPGDENVMAAVATSLSIRQVRCCLMGRALSMTDTDPLPSEPSNGEANNDYSLERFSRIMDSKKVSGICPMCNTDLWHSASSEEFKHYVPTQVLSTGVSVILLVCANCAFIRMHAIKVLRTIENAALAENTSNISEET